VSAVTFSGMSAGNPPRPAPPGGSQAVLRRANERRVLEALRSGGAASQAALARSTALSRQTVNNLVRSLAETGDVEVSAGANGRETLVSLRAATGAMIGVALGYGEARAVLVDLPSGARTDAVPAPLDGGREAASDDVDVIVSLIEGLLTDCGVTASDVLGLGVSVPQPLDARTQVMAPTPLMPGWADGSLLEVLSQRLGIAIVAENDANAAALAELRWGVGRECTDFVYVMASWGLGAGIIAGGQLFRGGSGMAGEIGHITIDDRGPVCTCGKRGDLGALASGRALVNQLRTLGDSDASLERLIHEARSGDVLATRLIADSGRYIGMALAHVVGILAPERIVLGGPLSDAGPVFSDPIAAALRDMVITPVAGGTELADSQLGADAALLGALALVIESTGIGTEAVPAWLRATPASAGARPSAVASG